MISTSILENYQPTIKYYDKNELILKENESAQYYYQIITGRVKMFNLTEDGKEFVQGFFTDKQSFGEPPLFGDYNYPASAICEEPTEVYQLTKVHFLKLILNEPETHLKFTEILCKRMIYKAKIMQEVSIHPPEHRILTLLTYFKSNSGTNDNDSYEVLLTRKQISELTGLRVETVIRAIKKLEKQKALIIKDRKVYI